MVFEDLSAPNTPPPPSGAPEAHGSDNARLAPVSDRLLSVIVDFSLFWPLFTLLLSSVLKKLQYRYYAAPESAEFWILLGVTVFGFAALTLFAQAMFWSVLGATPGQLFFQLRVRSLQTGKAPTLHASLLRGLFFLFEMALLGLPFLEVFSHPQRRALHDRAIDTEVITLKQIGMPVPHRLEIHFIRSFFTLCLALGLVWSFSLATSFYVSALRGEYKEAELSEAEYLCAEVPAREGARGIGGRLDAAVGMFLTGSLSLECLEAETDFAFWKGEKEDQSWAALALAVAKRKDPAAKAAYLEQVCAKDDQGYACKLAKWWSSREVEPAPANHLSWTRLVMSVQRAEENGDTETWKRELASVPSDFDLAEFLEVQKVKALWAEKKFEQAEGGYAVIWDQLSSRPQRELSTRLCLSEITQDCSVKSYRFCQDLEASLKNSPQETVDAEWLVALAEDKACRKAQDSDFLAYARDLDPNSETSKLIMTLLPESGLSESAKLENLRNVAFKSSSPALQTRALFHLLRTSRLLSDLEKSQKLLASESLPYQSELHVVFMKSAASMGFDVGPVKAERVPASAPADTQTQTQDEP